MGYDMIIQSVPADEKHADLRRNVDGIPLHKLSSRHGWHVAAAKCAEAVAVYEAARRDGFRVVER